MPKRYHFLLKTGAKITITADSLTKAIQALDHYGINEREFSEIKIEGDK